MSETATGMALRAIRNEIIEQCARVAEARARRYTTSGGAARSDEAREIAKDIRALALPSTNGNTP